MIDDKYGREGLVVKPLLLLPFVDDTSFGQFQRNTAKPFMLTIGNFTLDIIKADRSKTIMAFFPDIGLSKAQKKNKRYQLMKRLVEDKCVKILLDRIKVKTW